MSWSFRLFRFADTEVRMHITFPLLLIGIALLTYPQAGWQGALMAALFMLSLFACVLLHEFGHALTARRYGIRTPDITLLPIGGLARLERLPSNPRQEILIAIAGPLVNVAIAALIFPLLREIPEQTPFPPLQFSEFLPLLFMANLILVGFNLIPAFPMDGGRILRAGLAFFLPYARATRIAAQVGQGFAFLFLLVGILHYPLLILIAVFIFLAASQEASLAEMQHALRGIPVRDAMMTQFRTLPHGARIHDAAEALLAGSQHDFPIVRPDGSLFGLLTRSDLIAGMREVGEEAYLSQVASQKTPTIHWRAFLSDAFLTMQTDSIKAMPVLDDEGQLVGLLTRENIAELIMLRSARQKK